jgi:hypothetical protein
MPILLQYEISVGTSTVICISQSYTVKETHCMKDILSNTRNLFPFNSTQELRSYLIENFIGSVIYIVVTNNKATFTISPYGNSACIGIYNPTKTDAKPTLDVKLLHEHFYEKLNSAYTDIYDYLDVTISHLSDTVHSLASDTYSYPIPIQNSNQTINDILKNIPTYLPNNPNRTPVYPKFTEFFATSLQFCPDILFKNITRHLLEKQPLRQLNIILSSINQF